MLDPAWSEISLQPGGKSPFYKLKDHTKQTTTFSFGAYSYVIRILMKNS